MSTQDKMRQKLLIEFEQCKIKNPRYSLRSFANKLGLSSGSITDFLAGKRNFSNKKILLILKKLQLTPEEIDIFFLQDFDVNNMIQEIRLSKEGSRGLQSILSSFMTKIKILSGKNPGEETISVNINLKVDQTEIESK